MTLKNDRQIEFAELADKMGWRPVDVARALKLSKASVSKILAGEQSPRPQLLDLFRRVVADRLGQQGQIAEDNQRFAPTEHYVIEDRAREEAHTRLDQIADHDPRSFETLAVMLGSVHALKAAKAAQQKKVETVRSKPDPLKAAATTGDALIGAKLAGAALGLKPKAAATTYKNAAPARPAPPAKGAPKVPPAPVPVEREP